MKSTKLSSVCGCIGSGNSVLKAAVSAELCVQQRQRRHASSSGVSCALQASAALAGRLLVGCALCEQPRYG
eukprot:5607432-Pleurochrysis_carterae.AAC.1